jgi:hypothetical protein
LAENCKRGQWAALLALLKDGAKNAAIAYAGELCRANNVNEPDCLNAPEWIEQKQKGVNAPLGHYPIWIRPRPVTLKTC